MIEPLQRIYNWVLRIAAHEHAVLWLAGLSFVESSVFPIPVDVALMPMCLANRDKAFRYALICTVSSVIGGILGYAIGYFLFETIGKTIIEFYGLTKEFAIFRGKFNEWGVWVVFIAGCAPIPYKVITIASGVTQMKLVPFTVASIAGRSVRFYCVAGLIWKYGAPIQAFIEKYLGQLTLLFFALLIGGFIGLKYLL
ncbi:MAG: DedA family protein [Proteobacteria bacterium]|nr:DedA family protein [Pseudomonadota bacterium]